MSIKTQMASPRSLGKTNTVYDLLEGTALTTCFKGKREGNNGEAVMVSDQGSGDLFLFTVYLMTLSIDPTGL
jgi:hypothetical protein